MSWPATATTAPAWRRARASWRGECGAVRFLGYVPDEDLPDLYRLADLFVMPSTEEGFGIVYLEAAACGLRVVGGAGGGSGDAVPDERVGVLVDPADRDGAGRGGDAAACGRARPTRRRSSPTGGRISPPPRGYCSLALWPSRVV